MTVKQKRVLLRIALSLILLVVLKVLGIEKSWFGLLYIAPYLIIGSDILKKAFFGVMKRQPFDECFLMAVATLGAFVLGDYSEAVFVMLFYQVGELFQDVAVDKSRKSVADLMDIRPDFCNVKGSDGELVRVDPYEVSVGDLFYVKPGEKIPLDGCITEGFSNIDTVALTGESVPKCVGVGDCVCSGTVNMTSLLVVKAEKAYEDSTASRILDMVENASARKSVSERFISRFAKYYTPIVCLLALCLAIIPPTIILLFSGNNLYGTWIYRALTFLVISCPCALVVSVPLSFFAGIGCAGKNGILIKGSNYLEMLSKAGIVLFDKTGTVTKGVFSVTRIYSKNMSEERLHELVSLAESFSVHPISESLVKSYEKPLDKSRVSCFTDMSGLGISANIDGIPLLAGNSKLMKRYNIEFDEYDGSETVVYIAYGGRFEGYILISDVLKDSAYGLVKELKAVGCKRCFMLTGDRAAIADKVGRRLGADEVYSELLPDGKLDIAERFMALKGHSESLVFVGDGINDAPVLARADIGVAMGGLGSDAAIEAADVVIMDDNPEKLVTAVKIARKCISIVNFNVYFSIGIKLLFLIFSAFGVADMGLAVFADVGVMVIAVLNSVRSLKI